MCARGSVCVYACVYIHVCHICVDVRGQLSVSALLPPAGTFTSQVSHQSNSNRTFSNLLLFVCLLDFWERVSLYTSVWSVTHHSAQADLGFSILLLQPSRSWGFYRPVPYPGNTLQFFNFFFLVLNIKSNTLHISEKIPFMESTFPVKFKYMPFSYPLSSWLLIESPKLVLLPPL